MQRAFRKRSYARLFESIPPGRLKIGCSNPSKKRNLASLSTAGVFSRKASAAAAMTGSREPTSRVREASKDSDRTRVTDCCCDILLAETVIPVSLHNPANTGQHDFRLNYPMFLLDAGTLWLSTSAPPKPPFIRFLVVTHKCYDKSNMACMMAAVFLQVR
jgi:hypothetical protein